MGDPQTLRASDGDRERAAAEIREHYAQGRLDQDELNDRIGRAYAARTTGELDAIRGDLPALPMTRGAHRTELAARRSELARQLVQQTGAALVPFVLCTLVWLLSGAQSDFWPEWVALVALVPLLRNGWQLYGPAPDLDQAAENLAAQQQRRGHRRRRLL
jgi:hypothetical protein